MNYKRRAISVSYTHLYNLAASSGTIALAYNKKTHYKERSVYATATIGWDDTYILDASVRNDMSSTLSPNHNSYWYVGLCASVLAHKWVNAECLNFWKLRASAAQVGLSLIHI